MTADRILYRSWLGVLGFFILAGFFTAIRLFTEGHGLFNANDVLIWSLPLGGYVFLALTSSGLTLLASLPLVFGYKSFEPAAKRLVFLAVATLIGAFVNIGLELGSIFHMIYLLVSPNLSSPIWWMGAIYSLELVVLAMKLWRMHLGDWHSRYSRALGIVSFLCALIAPLMIGSVFGLTESRVTYFGPVMSIYCLLMALLSGTALFLIYSMIFGKVAGNHTLFQHASIHDRISLTFLLLLGIVTVFTLLKIAIESSTVIPEFLNYHRYKHAFGTWGSFHSEAILGLFIPLILMAIPAVRSSINGRIVAAALSLLGTLAMHLEILVAGQSRPVGPKAEQLPEIVSYVPSTWEWLVFAFGVSVMLLLYTLGERHLKLDQTPDYSGIESFEGEDSMAEIYKTQTGKTG